MAIQSLMKIQQSDLDAYRQHYAPNASPEEWALFVETCQAYGLSPMRKQIYLVSRPTWNAKERKQEWKAAAQVSIEGLRDIAARTNKYQGRVGPFWKSKTGEWSDCWNIDDGPYPYAAKVGIWKEGFREPLFAVVYFHEMAQYTGKDNERKLNSFWQKMGIIMLAKCAEAASVRAAFPETSGLYIHEEMQQANAEAEYTREAVRITPEPDNADAEAITGEVVDELVPAAKSPSTKKQQAPAKSPAANAQQKPPTNQQQSKEPLTPGQLTQALQSAELIDELTGRVVDLNLLIEITGRKFEQAGRRFDVEAVKALGSELSPKICHILELMQHELIAAKKTASQAAA